MDGFYDCGSGLWTEMGHGKAKGMPGMSLRQQHWAPLRTEPSFFACQYPTARLAADDLAKRRTSRA